MNVEDVARGDNTFTLLTLDHLHFLRQKRLPSDNRDQTEVMKELSTFCFSENQIHKKFFCNKLLQLFIALLTLIPNNQLCKTTICLLFTVYFGPAPTTDQNPKRKRSKICICSSSSEDNVVFRGRKFRRL